MFQCIFVSLSRTSLHDVTYHPRFYFPGKMLQVIEWSTNDSPKKDPSNSGITSFHWKNSSTLFCQARNKALNTKEEKIANSNRLVEAGHAESADSSMTFPHTSDAEAQVE
eukprot:gb/GECG01001981.1/.p1 GENE.gb/GECG01001981.1/~~gb/GECG01001981.1/.p1  ORF type:complete len:110 (+),score=11.67 gb/GECG01001981.1/:1-330(+)